MQITSPVFSYNENIPEQYTCLGKNINPPLQIKDVPHGAQSLVLIFEDADATPEPWTHWMLFNIPPSTTVIEEGSIPDGAIEGLANNHSFGYEGPCPRYFNGTHHYWFWLYAIDKVLDLPADSERNAVQKSMTGHVLDKTALQGLCTAHANIPASGG